VKHKIYTRIDEIILFKDYPILYNYITKNHYWSIEKLNELFGYARFKKPCVIFCKEVNEILDELENKEVI